MANEEHVRILKQGVEAWNQWRAQNSQIEPDLREAALGRASLEEANLYRVDLRGADLSRARLKGSNLRVANLKEANLQEAKLTGVDFSKANLSKANLMGANLGQAKLVAADASNANLIGANLIGANLNKANFAGAKLSGAHLSEANLRETNFTEANLQQAFLIKTDLSKANLSGANLNQAHLVSTNLTGANLTGCSIHGMSAWDLKLNERTKQSGLIISPPGAPIIAVHDIEVAQFIYLLITNKNVRNIIDPVVNKAVLILGHFTKRKEILSAIADEFTKMDLCPIIFDFQKSGEQGTIETAKALAGLSKFIVADVTVSKVIADQLASFMAEVTIPVVPLFQRSTEDSKPYASFYTLQKKSHWVLQPLVYENKGQLLNIFREQVVKPAQARRLELMHKESQ